MSQNHTHKKEVKLTEYPIELCQLLKFENLAQSGGEAKFFISEGKVTLNGETETRKRKKIVPGDIVEFNGVTLKIVQG